MDMKSLVRMHPLAKKLRGLGPWASVAWAARTIERVKPALDAPEANAGPADHRIVDLAIELAVAVSTSGQPDPEGLERYRASWQDAIGEPSPGSRTDEPREPATADQIEARVTNERRITDKILRAADFAANLTGCAAELNAEDLPDRLVWFDTNAGWVAGAIARKRGANGVAERELVQAAVRADLDAVLDATADDPASPVPVSVFPPMWSAGVTPIWARRP